MNSARGSNSRAVLLSNHGRGSSSFAPPMAASSPFAQRRSPERSNSVTSMGSPRSVAAQSLFESASPRRGSTHLHKQPALPGPKDMCPSSRFRDRYAKSEVFHDKGRRHYSPPGTDPLSQARGERSAALRQLASSSSIRGISKEKVADSSAFPFAASSTERASSSRAGSPGGSCAASGTDDLFNAPGARWSPRRSGPLSRSPSPSVSICGDSDWGGWQFVSEADRQLSCSSRPRLRQPSVASLLRDISEAAPADETSQRSSARRVNKVRNTSPHLASLLHNDVGVEGSPPKGPAAALAERTRCLGSSGSLVNGFKSDDAGCLEQEFGTKPRGRGSRAPTPRGEAAAVPTPWATAEAEVAPAPVELPTVTKLAQIARNCLQSQVFITDSEMEAQPQPQPQPQTSWRPHVQVSQARAVTPRGYVAPVSQARAVTPRGYVTQDQQRTVTPLENMRPLAETTRAPAPAGGAGSPRYTPQIVGVPKVDARQSSGAWGSSRGTFGTGGVGTRPSAQAYSSARGTRPSAQASPPAYAMHMAPRTAYGQRSVVNGNLGMSMHRDAPAAATFNSAALPFVPTMAAWPPSANSGANGTAEVIAAVSAAVKGVVEAAGVGQFGCHRMVEAAINSNAGATATCSPRKEQRSPRTTLGGA